MQTHHYRILVASIVSALGAMAVAGGLFWAYQYFWARFQPIILTKEPAAIQRLLDQGDWISPGRKGAPVYLLTYRACDACAVYQRQEFPKLAAVDVDTRVIVAVQPDEAGQSLSTPQERATVAELWINRDWGLYQRWMASTEESWAPAGLRSADGDWARSAVVGATRAYVDKVMVLLKENGLTSGDPIVIWRDKKGRLKACACADRLSYHFVRSDFHAPDTAPAPAVSPPSPPLAPLSAPPPIAPTIAKTGVAPAPAPALPASSAPANPGAPSPPPAASTPPSSTLVPPATPPGDAGKASPGGAGAATVTKKPLTRSEGSGRNVFY